MMRTVHAIFRSDDETRRARVQCLAIGIPEERLTVSVSQTADGIAGEAPGQSYENQPDEKREDEGGLMRRLGDWVGGKASYDTQQAEYGEDVRSAVRVLSVDTQSDDEARRVSAILRGCGGTVEERTLYDD
jgi:hypothetical protein